MVVAAGRSGRRNRLTLGCMNFEFATATRIIFGPGSIRQAGALGREFGTRALLVTGRDTDRAEPLLASLRAAGVATELFPVSGEPDLATVETGVSVARTFGAELVIGCGGGSALDAGKAIAALLTNPGALLDYLEIIGRGQALTRPPAPFLAIPTTAGTGSEVTRNAVLASPVHRAKVSLRSPLMLPKVALVDPELAHHLPPALTASTGLDALTQLIEPFVCSRANPLTDAFCMDGIPRAARSLPIACRPGTHPDARADMALASLLSGFALANAGLGAVHGLAGPLGGEVPAPHGAVCAILLPLVMAANLRALAERQPSSVALVRYEVVARLLTGNPAASTAEGVAWVRELVARLAIPPLRQYGVTRELCPGIVGKAALASSMKANPIVLTAAELMEILEQAH